MNLAARDQCVWCSVLDAGGVRPLRMTSLDLAVNRLRWSGDRTGSAETTFVIISDLISMQCLTVQARQGKTYKLRCHHIGEMLALSSMLLLNVGPLLWSHKQSVPFIKTECRSIHACNMFLPADWSPATSRFKVRCPPLRIFGIAAWRGAHGLGDVIPFTTGTKYHCGWQTLKVWLGGSAHLFSSMIPVVISLKNPKNTDTCVASASDAKQFCFLSIPTDLSLSYLEQGQGYHL